VATNGKFQYSVVERTIVGR